MGYSFKKIFMESLLSRIIIEIASSSFLVIAMTLVSDICQIKEHKNNFVHKASPNTHKQYTTGVIASPAKQYHILHGHQYYGVRNGFKQEKSGCRQQRKSKSYIGWLLTHFQIGRIIQIVKYLRVFRNPILRVNPFRIYLI